MRIHGIELPNVEDITCYDDVIKVINTFCEHPEMVLYAPEYSFAHIVLDDYNLENEWIVNVQTDTFSIQRWIGENARFDPNRLRRYGIAADAILLFLAYLLEIPESLRVLETGVCIKCGFVEADQIDSYFNEKGCICMDFACPACDFEWTTCGENAKGQCDDEEMPVL